MMTLTEAKELLNKNNIAFNLLEFENETEYFHHSFMFPYTKSARSDKVTAIVIESNNGKKNIELQFNEIDGVYQFEEMLFGEFCYEMFNYNEEMLADDLIHNIKEIKTGNLTVIVLNDIKNHRWLSDARFDLSDDDEGFGKTGFQKAMKKIEKPKSFLSKINKSKFQYEIYDWNTYHCIIK
ncbi:MAG: hypothetical protein IJZ57_06300 [Clostridia bacterium]|nr:hypothetical protein [Clostridia bacterium]